jgi:hypothetical protein
MVSSLMRFFSRSARRTVVFGFVFLTLASVGCSGKRAKVTGKLTFHGQPVTGGSLTLVPVPAAGDLEPGTPAAVAVNSDGTFATPDGAVVGRCKVFYSAPSVPFPEGRVQRPSEPAPMSPFVGLVPKEQEIEVTTGDNTLEVEMIPRGK